MLKIELGVTRSQVRALPGVVSSEALSADDNSSTLVPKPSDWPGPDIRLSLQCLTKALSQSFQTGSKPCALITAATCAGLRVSSISNCSIAFVGRE